MVSCRYKKNVDSFQLVKVAYLELSQDAVFIYDYSQPSTVKTSLTGTSLGPYKFILDMGSLSHGGVIIAPGQETIGNN